ncbi:mannose-6-phosphate isomerase [Trinickia symbiotica]|uniref:N-acylglucosamine 2-epimerase n=1 Tax=Trinickia symbiotica TaxID=863227 RepID=A0A2N7X769_9BURK|nr:AGE family epimerase/isomerase [Trinickia symbiotica]PMS37457.1 N-acylglucosamine 2-epimerase [Trinickia symbiotica]PPK42849.1 mannose-6-phosphate isomerase [Trinickia symbiotica]
MSNPTDAAITAQSAALSTHFTQIVLPLWRAQGFNASMQLPYEALRAEDQTPLPVARYRAMACARQLFVFSLAGDAAHAQTLFASLRRYFRDERHGGWFYSVDAAGAPLETTKDLYTHAFVVFACASYLAAFGDSDARDVLGGTAALIGERFAGTEGLLHSALDERFSSVRSGPLQNPLMHLTEAYLAAHEATRDAAFEEALGGLATAVARTFVHAPTGAIAELPIGTEGNRIEPGHQFEWFYLVARAGSAIAASGLAASLERAFDFAQRHGVDAQTGGVCAALNEDGSIQDATQRIWAQTEYLRALATRGTPADRGALASQIEHFRTRFLHPLGWYECKTADGEIARGDMPSTTPYHLATAYASLPA